MKNIPAADFRTMDQLWTAYSRGRYGFSVQRSLWLAEKRRWKGFFTRIGWTTGANGAYRKFPNEFLWAPDAPKGHLPLTNCLRGTQLLQAVLEHPAFGGALAPQGVRASDIGATVTYVPDGEEAPPAQRAALLLGAIAVLAAALRAVYVLHQ